MNTDEESGSHCKGPGHLYLHVPCCKMMLIGVKTMVTIP